MKFVTQSIQQLSTSVKRLIFEDTSNTLKLEHESGYVKLILNTPEGNKMRSYTIREVEENLVTIDFVKHEKGIAHEWVEQVSVGDTIEVKGPGASKLVDTSLDWFLLLGDLTALPAIAVNLKNLPKDAKGFAIIEIRDENDKQALSKPDGVELIWVVNPEPTDSVKTMLSVLKQLSWLTGTPYLWVATEFDCARALRQYFKDEKGIIKNRYISSYWKLGETDEGNKRAKKRDGGF